MSTLGDLYRDVILPATDPAWMFAEPGLGPGPADEWQRSFLADPSPFKMQIAPRRVGKTELEVMSACAALLEGRTLLTLAPTLEQSFLAGRRIRAACAKYAASGRPGCERLKPINQSRDCLMVACGGIQYNLPAKDPDRIRGYDLDGRGKKGDPDYKPAGVVLWDEAAFHQEAEEMWRILVHMVDTERDGRAEIYTTPGYIGTLAHRIAIGEESGWSVHEITVHEAQRTYTPERLAMAEKMAGDGAAQELFLQWRHPSDEHLMFDENALNSIFGENAFEDENGERVVEKRETAPSTQRAIWVPGQEVTYFDAQDDDLLPEPVKATLPDVDVPVVSRPSYKIGFQR